VRRQAAPDCGNWTRLSAALTAQTAARRETHTFSGSSRRAACVCAGEGTFVAASPDELAGLLRGAQHGALAVTVHTAELLGETALPGLEPKRRARRRLFTCESIAGKNFATGGDTSTSRLTGTLLSPCSAFPYSTASARRTAPELAACQLRWITRTRSGDERPAERVALAGGNEAAGF
jgi:hypothetical protein